MFQYVICVSCLPGSERLICNSIRENLGLPALYPTWTRELWKENRFVPHTQPVLSGYIFVYTDNFNCIGKLKRMDKVYRVLQYGDGTYDLYGEDRAFAQWVFEQNGQIGLSRAMMTGDEMVIIDGPMKDYEGKIKRIDKHNRYAQIEITLDGITRTICLGFQWMTYKDGVMVRWDKQNKGVENHIN